MILVACFTSSGAPATGLSPTISVRKVSDNSVVVNAQAMTEVGSGWYKYDYTGWQSSVDYVWTCDGGSGQSLGERYVFGASNVEGAATDILADTNEVQLELADGGRLDLLVDAVKAKTDNLPSDPADESLLEAAITAAQVALTSEINANETKINTIDTVVDAIKLKTDLIPASPATETTLTDIHGDLAGKPTLAQIEASTVLAKEATLTDIHSDIGTVDTVVDAVKAKTDNLPTDPADQSQVEAAITAAQGAIITQIDANETKIDTVDSIVDAIKAKTDNLPSDPADASVVAADITSAKDAIILQIDANETKIDVIDALIDSIKAKTDNLPSDPADQSQVEIAITAAIASVLAGVPDVVLDEAVEGTYTLRQLVRIFSAILAGKTTGGRTDTGVFRDINDTKDRVTVTMTQYGDRTAVVVDAA